MAISRSLQPRQQYGLGSFVKKFTKPIKKIIKSPLGKAAIIGGLGMIPWGTAGAGGTGLSTWGRLGGGLKSLFRAPQTLNAADKGGFLSSLFRHTAGDKKGQLHVGKMALGALGLTGVTAPFLGGKEEEEAKEDDWWQMPDSMSNLLTRSKDYYTDYSPYTSDLSFMPKKQFVDPSFYAAAEGGLAKLANGGQPG